MLNQISVQLPNGEEKKAETEIVEEKNDEEKNEDKAAAEAETEQKAEAPAEQAAVSQVEESPKKKVWIFYLIRSQSDI